MKSTLAIAALISCSCATLVRAGQEGHPWLGIVKSTDGFLFEGRLGRTEFSFDIPGDQIQVAQQEEPDDPERTHAALVRQHGGGNHQEERQPQEEEPEHEFHRA